MKRSLLPVSLVMGSVLFATICSAQQSDRFVYAVTDAQEQGSNWHFLRKLNLQTGEYSQPLLSGNDVSIQAFDATSRKKLEAPLTDARYGGYVNAAFATGVAAVAFDKRNNRLYYTPMLFDQLRYVDLKTMNVYYVTDQIFTGKPQKSSSQGDIVTRMTIASDGNGYAMTNDATQLIRFTTGKKLTITDLGALVDDPANKGVSIHNSCSSFGGDMIADDNGNLYIFSARNNVFKVNIESKVATYLGAISGLPNGFTVNGAVVNDKNEILVASAVQSGSWFVLDAKSWNASAFQAAGTVWQSSDLANSNLLATKQSSVAPELISRTVPTNPGDSKISIYPNPVTNNQFMVQFNSLEAGSYTLKVTDVTGRQVVQQVVNVNSDSQTQSIKLADASAKGVYMINVVDGNSKSVYTTKIVVQ
jgi:hypothetical protein